MSTRVVTDINGDVTAKGTSQQHIWDVSRCECFHVGFMNWEKLIGLQILCPFIVHLVSSGARQR